jgi:catechol-2,3-dioxygenase
VSDIEVAAAQLAALGIEPLEPMTDQSFGHRTLFFADPEDNIIEVYAEI